MTLALLEVKSYVSRERASWVSRRRLIRHVGRGCQRKLTLLSAPAGFGKTTFHSEWVVRTDGLVPWLSHDEVHNDHHRFWTYPVAALRRIRPDLGEVAASASRLSQPFLPEYVLTERIKLITESRSPPTVRNLKRSPLHLRRLLSPRVP